MCGHEKNNPKQKMNVILNMTYQGQSGDYAARFNQNVSDNEVRRVCEEAVRAGEVKGITNAIPNGAFDGTVVDRYFGSEGARFIVRPKVPFG